MNGDLYYEYLLSSSAVRLISFGCSTEITYSFVLRINKFNVFFSPKKYLLYLGLRCSPQDVLRVAARRLQGEDREVRENGVEQLGQQRGAAHGDARATNWETSRNPDQW